MPLMLQVLHFDASPRRIHSLKILHALRLIDAYLEGTSYHVVPALARLFEYRGTTSRRMTILILISHASCVMLHDALAEAPELQKEALFTFAYVSHSLEVKPFAARVMQPLIRLLESQSPTDVDLHKAH
jgi:hypothetical protein